MPRPRIPDRRERILDHAERLIVERGFDAMSVQRIADEVGIAKGAVYREFSSKAEILDVLLNRAMARMTDRSRELLGDQPDPPLSRSYAVGAEVLLDDPLMTAAFLDDRGILGARVEAATDDRYRDRHRQLVSWIRRLQADAGLAPDLDADHLALVLSSTTLGLLTAAARLGPFDRDELRGAIELMARMVAGLETRPDHADLD